MESAKICRRCQKFGGIKFFAESVHRSAFAAQNQSFLCGKFSTARLEVLPNLRHVRVFQMSTMVNLGIGIQEPLTRASVKLDEEMSIFSSDSGPEDHGGYTN